MKNMTIKEVNEMRNKGFANFEKEKLLDAYTITNATKNTFADLEKDIKSALESKMNVGDQLMRSDSIALTRIYISLVKDVLHLIVLMELIRLLSRKTISLEHCILISLNI